MLDIWGVSDEDFKAFVWGKNGNFQEGVFVFIVAILPSAAPGLRTIKGDVLDIFPWNLHTLCNLLFPMSWQRVFSK